MNLLLFILLVLVVAPIAASVQTIIAGPWGSRPFAGRWVAYALLLVLPTLLPRLLGG